MAHKAAHTASAKAAKARPPYRADHVGSLLRPPQLAQARAQWHEGKLSAEALRIIEDKAIAQAVALQEGAGLRSITDGEFRRDYWHLDFMWGFDGVEPSSETVPVPFSNGEFFTAPMAIVTAKVRYPAHGIMRDHFKYLAKHTKRTPKFTAPAPTMFRHRSGRKAVSEQAYPDIGEFWADLGQAYNAAMRDLASAGCRYLQLDDVNSCMLCDEQARERIRGQGGDPDTVLGQNIAVINASIAGRPADMVVTTHFCRGNYKSQWMAAGGYEAIADRFLSQVDVDGFFMEYDSERAGDFKPLRFLPKGKIAVLGLISSKLPQLESKDALKRRIEEAARYAPLEQLALSPQCGFSSTHHGNALSHDDQRRKLELIVSVAEDVWGSAQ